MVVGTQVLMVTTETIGEALAGLAGAAAEELAGLLDGIALDCIMDEAVLAGLFGADWDGLDDGDIGDACAELDEAIGAIGAIEL